MGCYDDWALGLQTAVTTRSPGKPKDAASERSLEAFVTVVVWKLMGLENGAGVGGGVPEARRPVETSRIRYSVLQRSPAWPWV